MDRGTDRGRGSSGREAPGAEAREARTVCMVPADLARRLVGLLREHFADQQVEVVVEHRASERRSASDRRRADVPDQIPRSGDRRQIHNAAGRRVADRRAPVTPLPPPEDLPRRARRHVERLVFAERLEPTAEQREDEDTARRVIAFQAGDPEAFSTLYRRYFDRVYSYLRVVLRDRDEAEDLTQDVFLRALGALPRYERRAQPFRAWLFTIARNHVLQTLERISRVELTEDMREVMEQQPGARVMAEQISAPSWITDSDLHILIERLPEVQREVLVLRYLLDLRPAEIAPVLGTTPNHVSVLQYRALDFLRKRLAALGRESSRSDRSPTRRPPGKVAVVRQRRFALVA